MNWKQMLQPDVEGIINWTDWATGSDSSWTGTTCWTRLHVLREYSDVRKRELVQHVHIHVHYAPFWFIFLLTNRLLCANQFRLFFICFKLGLTLDWICFLQPQMVTFYWSLLGWRVRIPPGEWMSLFCECCVLSGRCLYVGQITRREKSYRVWRVCVCVCVFVIVSPRQWEGLVPLGAVAPW